MTDAWLATVPVLAHFAEVADRNRYAPLPDDWRVGLSDVVDSTDAIAQGRYRAVNLAGAGTISGVANALGGTLPLFAFGGDGARFAVPPDEAEVAADALSRVAMWAARNLDLELRVGMTGVAQLRAAGQDARVAFWQASRHVRYAMFTGGGLEWAEAQLKGGHIGLPAAAAGDEPDLTGLSCQWGAIAPTRGTIVSLIVKQAPAAPEARFAVVATDVLALLDDGGGVNPVPAAGPAVRWPAGSIALQARIARGGQAGWRRHLGVLAAAALSWTAFRLGLRLGGFDAGRYRGEIAANTDFRKFDDGLMMTVDCAPDTVTRLRELLDGAVRDGTVRYGLHTQDRALMTCVVPSVTTSDHMHFIDGAGGGYAAAARMLRDQSSLR